MRIYTLLATAALLSAGSMASAAVVDNFNSYAGVNAGSPKLTDNWNINVADGDSGNVGLSASGGLGSSQGVTFVDSPTAGGIDLSLVNKSGSFDFNAPTTATISIFFKRNTGGTGQGNPDLEFVGSDAQLVNATNAIGVRFNGSNQLQIRNNNGGSVVSSAITLTTNNWYKLVGTIVRTSTSNAFTVAADLYNSDSLGIVGASVGSIGATSVTNSGLWNDTTVFGAVRITGQSTGVANAQVLDNFSAAVPEPASLSLLGLGGLAMLRRRRA